MRIIILFCVIFLMLGCASGPKPVQPTDKIKVGMDESDVRDILGLPEYWQSSEDEKEEVWQFCLTERFNPVNEVVVVWFLERHVTGVDAYTNVGFGGCKMFFRTLKWKDAPHRKKTR